MAPVFQWGPHFVFFRLLLLLHCLLMSTGVLDVIDHDAPELTCSEGLGDCRVSSARPTADYDSVDVTHMELRAALCGSDYKPCLQINITLNDMDLPRVSSEESGDDSDNEDMQSALVKVCLSSPGIIDVCRILQFKHRNPHLSQPSRRSSYQLLLTEHVDFGMIVVVVAESRETHIVQNITIPHLEEVCTSDLGRNVTECIVPRLQAVTEYERNVIRLQLENADYKHKELSLQMIWNDITGEILTWPKGKSEMAVSLDFVAPCLCFQVWWKGDDLRGQYCPFTHQQDALERLWHNVFMTVVEIQMRTGGTGLRWNVSSLCKLEAEVVLCKKGAAGGQCEEVMGSRQELKAGWIAEHNRHWLTGDFNVSRHPLICVQVKIKGVEFSLEPHCPFATSRVRWIVPLLLGLLLICLVTLGSYFIQGVLKGYVWRWLKEDDVKGAVGGGHLVLLYPSDEDDYGLPGLLCHLGSSLQSLGFTVSLDLWSQAELAMLGPVPWLHSQLDRLQRQGGKVVLVLTRATWTRAEEWGAWSCEKNTPREKSRSVEEETGGSSPASSQRVDVFGASLSCILADYLQGRAGERFMLVQFESLPPEPPGGFRPLPQLFRGLHVYTLPSQSLAFLTELAGTPHMASASARRKRAGGLRIASRALARRLSGFTVGTNVLRLAGVQQGCVGVGEKDSGETVPLKPCLITPPSSPDTKPKVNEMEWM